MPGSPYKYGGNGNPVPLLYKVFALTSFFIAAIDVAFNAIPAISKSFNVIEPSISSTISANWFSLSQCGANVQTIFDYDNLDDANAIIMFIYISFFLFAYVSLTTG